MLYSQRVQCQVNDLHFVHTQNIGQALDGAAAHAGGTVLGVVTKGDLSGCGFHGGIQGR